MPRTDVPEKEARIVYLRSEGRCAFPGCGRELIEPGNTDDDSAYIGEIAHIVADSRQGPRGNSPMTDEQRDHHDNLILLCRVCHGIIDSQPLTYSVSVLRAIKADHEDRIRQASAPDAEPAPIKMKREVSPNFLKVERFGNSSPPAFPQKVRDSQATAGVNDHEERHPRVPDGQGRCGAGSARVPTARASGEREAPRAGARVPGVAPLAHRGGRRSSGSGHRRRAGHEHLVHDGLE
jgi:hypothetical protein